MQPSTGILKGDFTSHSATVFTLMLAPFHYKNNHIFDAFTIEECLINLNDTSHSFTHTHCKKMCVLTKNCLHIQVSYPNVT